MMKWIIAIIVIILIVAGVWYWQTNKVSTPVETGPIKIGAILPLSGPVAIWGENIKNGMEIAKSELAQSGDSIDIIYEDSQGLPTPAISAFQKLADLDKVNVVFSIFSRVSVPLVNLAKEKNIPLMMSVVSASGVANAEDGSFRFYSDAKQYVDPHLVWLTKEKYDEVAILAINDEFGSDVGKILKERLKEKDIKLIAEEKYAPNSTDFKTQLTKIKSSEPKAIIFIGSVPGEITNALRQVKELGIKTDFVEASASLVNVVTSPALIGSLGENANLAEGVYTIAFPFTIGKTGDDFKVKYREAYNQEPNFAAAFGYDMVMLTLRANGLKGQDLSEKLVTVGNYESLNGPVSVLPSGEINPQTYSVRIVNGKIVPVE